MALVVENGTGLSNAESYVSVADAGAYHAARGNTAWAALASDELREQALRKATDYMVQRYRPLWLGMRLKRTQALDWPRSGVIMEDTHDSIGGELPHDEIPQEVIYAAMDLALKASGASLAPDITRAGAIHRQKVGPLELEYDQGASQVTQYRAIDLTLMPYLRRSPSSSNVPLIRS